MAGGKPARASLFSWGVRFPGWLINLKNTAGSPLPYIMESRFETPILFLIFNRPDTTRLVFNQIKKVQPRRLFVAADGARQSVAGERERCEETRKIISEVEWDCDIQTLYREQNLGCGSAVSSALTWFFEHVAEGIILEDDCYPDLSFFNYCTDLLSRYRHTDRVKLIGGNNFQDGITRGTGSYYFSHYPEIWGWASWRRVWQQYDFDMSGLNETFREEHLKDVYKSNEEKKYWYQQFMKTKEGAINTWDYQLVYSILKTAGIAISPQVNLVKNIGIDNNATHTSLYDSKKDLQINSLKFPLVHPQMIVDKEADHYTFTQIYSRSPQRLLRLIKENGAKNILLYTLNKLFK
jgi:hypothetical protein